MTKHTPGQANAVMLALREAEALGYGPVRRHWFALGAELEATDPGRKKALRPTERQGRWLSEGQSWFRAAIAKAEAA